MGLNPHMSIHEKTNFNGCSHVMLIQDGHLRAIALPEPKARRLCGEWWNIPHLVGWYIWDILYIYMIYWWLIHVFSYYKHARFLQPVFFQQACGFLNGLNFLIARVYSLLFAAIESPHVFGYITWTVDVMISPMVCCWIICFVCGLHRLLLGKVTYCWCCCSCSCSCSCCCCCWWSNFIHASFCQRR